MTENNDFNNIENDSTISRNEKRFIKGYHTIRDTYENKTYDFRVDIICNLLNELDEKWIAEFSLRETLQQELQRVENENEKLKDEVYDELDNTLTVLTELYEVIPIYSQSKMNSLYNRLKSLRDDIK